MELVEALRQIPELFALVAGIVGLLVGSFLNVVIHRVPRMLERAERYYFAQLVAQDEAAARAAAGGAGEPAEVPRPPKYNLVVPRSACPSCNAPITALQNLPVVSWLALRGRCANCRAPISARYPIVELVTGLLSALVAWHFGWGWEAACGLVITWFLIAMCGIDIDTQLLPDGLTLTLLWGGLLAAAWLGRGPGPIPVDLKSAVLGAAFGYLALWSVAKPFELLTGRESGDSMGHGDFKLLAALGAWLGWQMLLPIVLLSAASGAIIGLVLIALRRLGREVPIPFGPYLAVAGWLVMMYSPELVSPWWALAR